MNIDWGRRYCISLPHATESVQWGNNLVFKIGGVIPAPYLARSQWVALETEDALAPGEIKRLLEAAHRLVLEKLPKKARAALA
ncbi:MAG: MmcQ/YjbR family DNA-binding protein [Bryobacteraceae bacterium]